jgi:hypothetical protein
VFYTSYNSSLFNKYNIDQDRLAWYLVCYIVPVGAPKCPCRCFAQPHGREEPAEPENQN